MKKIVVLDVETGGLDPVQHSILSVGAVVGDLDTGIIEGTFHAPVEWPVYRVTAGALAVNDIDLRTFDGPFVTWSPEEIKERFRNFILGSYYNASSWDKIGGQEKPRLAGHSIAFDIAFYKQVDPDFLEMFKRRTIDTSSIVALDCELGRVPAGVGSLVSACKHYGIEPWQAHEALGDAKATFQLLCKLRAR